MLPEIERFDVLIVGGGPFGLTLALELGRRKVAVLLVDAKPGTAFNPQANATQARTMEHFRRLGLSKAIREQGLPADHPTDIAYFTRLCGYELARLRLPTARQAAQAVQSMAGSWSAAELPHRVSQKFVEATLLKAVLKHPSVSIRFGHRMHSFQDHGSGVTAIIEDLHKPNHAMDLQVQADYLVGADGARSVVRRALGFEWLGETGVRREFMGGKMFAVYFSCPQFYQRFPHDLAWMYVSVNPQRRGFMATVDGRGEFALHAAVRDDENAEDWTESHAKDIVSQVMGMSLPIDVKSVGVWMAGHALYANHFQKDRVFIGGDAAHLFTPTGGLGYNTAVEDAVNLGWKMAYVVQGLAPQALLNSYEIERQPLAIRNTAYARQFADSVGLFQANDLLEATGPDGDAQRQLASEHLSAHVRLEFNIPGVTFGGRYDASPIIVCDGSQPPPDHPNQYQASACPGGRPPHAWLGPDDSLFDHFGPEWTLLILSSDDAGAATLVEVAQANGIALKVLHRPGENLLALYQASFVLIRPDQVVAWRSSGGFDAQEIWSQVLGGSGFDEPVVKAL